MQNKNSKFTMSESNSSRLSYVFDEKEFGLKQIKYKSENGASL